ncbi:TetR family transcriptional regulator [Kitasatospora sp. NA04385]|uniref:TetR/AcrR family transcriptional regulator n=1 Tax=Kitasatospora sp. NA04385 TaxID=2742135 RepID=UPI001590FACA|nr:TetR/AcrR family transcriptional regulator [Kitasatospora sp. NA04385]QKW23750.1 TetR family transcriptional regulator [Kitasatospora sp. NA04385]
MTTSGLRERKKRATRAALREAALRLALEHGPDGVRVEDIAEAAGVSPRTYNNYFASREQAIAAAVAADREERIAAAVAARPADVRLADAVADAVVEQYADPGAQSPEALRLVVARPALREAFLDTAAGIGPPLAEAIAGRLGEAAPETARVLAASTAAAVRIALEDWLRPADGEEGREAEGRETAGRGAGRSAARSFPPVRRPGGCGRCWPRSRPLSTPPSSRPGRSAARCGGWCRTCGWRGRGRSAGTWSSTACSASRRP